MWLYWGSRLVTLSTLKSPLGPVEAINKMSGELCHQILFFLCINCEGCPLGVWVGKICVDLMRKRNRLELFLMHLYLAHLLCVCCKCPETALEHLFMQHAKPIEFFNQCKNLHHTLIVWSQCRCSQLSALKSLSHLHSKQQWWFLYNQWLVTIMSMYCKSRINI